MRSNLISGRFLAVFAWLALVFGAAVSTAWVGFGTRPSLGEAAGPSPVTTTEVAPTTAPPAPPTPIFDVADDARSDLERAIGGSGFDIPLTVRVLRADINTDAGTTTTRRVVVVSREAPTQPGTPTSELVNDVTITFVDRESGIGIHDPDGQLAELDAGAAAAAASASASAENIRVEARSGTSVDVDRDVVAAAQAFASGYSDGEGSSAVAVAAAAAVDNHVFVGEPEAEVEAELETEDAGVAPGSLIEVYAEAMALLLSDDVVGQQIGASDVYEATLRVERIGGDVSVRLNGLAGYGENGPTVLGSTVSVEYEYVVEPNTSLLDQDLPTTMAEQLLSLIGGGETADAPSEQWRPIQDLVDGFLNDLRDVVERARNGDAALDELDLVDRDDGDNDLGTGDDAAGSGVDDETSSEYESETEAEAEAEAEADANQLGAAAAAGSASGAAGGVEAGEVDDDAVTSGVANATSTEAAAANGRTDGDAPLDADPGEIDLVDALVDAEAGATTSSTTTTTAAPSTSGPTTAAASAPVDTTTTTTTTLVPTTATTSTIPSSTTTTTTAPTTTSTTTTTAPTTTIAG